MNIGVRLRDLRLTNHLTQAEVGCLLGVSKATVNRYETGEIDIKRTTALKLGYIFNVSPSYIMGWTDEKKVLKSSDKDENSLYDKLNELGKQKADEYITDLLYNPKYTTRDTDIDVKDGRAEEHV